MRVGNFELSVSPGREIAGGYVEMQHGTQYTLWLRNLASARCDAEVSIDGKPVGTFRINSHGCLDLERSATDHGRFTFYKSGTSDASKAGLDAVSDANLGLIQVTFRPEHAVIPRPVTTYRPAGIEPRKWVGSEREVRTSGGIRLPDEGSCMGFSDDGPSGIYGSSSMTRGLSAGGTGLSGHSHQSFYEVANLNYDPSGVVTITLRLAAGSTEPRRLEPVSSPVPAPLAR